MSDIETLSVLTTNDKTIGMQLTSGNRADKRQRNWKCERAVQTEGGKLERSAYNRQDIDAQKAVHEEGRKLNHQQNCSYQMIPSCLANSVLCH